MTQKLTRRQILQLLAVAAGGTSLALFTKLGSLLGRAQVPGQDNTFLPIVLDDKANPTATRTATSPIPTNANTPTPTRTPTQTAGTPTTPPPPPENSRVVQVHSASASDWTGSGNYWDHVSQAAVDNMVDQGMMWLTGAASVTAAWSAILPNYQAGQKVAIKVSFNNATSCNDTDGQIDSIIEPLNAVIRGLKTIGVTEPNIWVYDATRPIPSRYMNGCDYPGVVFYGTGSCNTPTTFTSNAPNAVVTFNPPSGPGLAPQHQVDTVINANYLINMPIMKRHGMSGVSLALKNHYGTTQDPESLHEYNAFASPYYTSTYSPFIDLYSNPHIGGKTVLTIGENIFCARQGNTAAPTPWTTFGNQYPKSLLFAVDPVAIDCVMCDFLNAELPGGIHQYSDDYLVLAHNAGLGTYERGNPWANPASSGYDLIDYQKLEL